MSISGSTRTSVWTVEPGTAQRLRGARVLAGMAISLTRACSTLTSSVVTLTLAANAWGQAAITASVANGYVRFEPTGAASCYAVAVDNGTNAGRFIEAVEYAP